MDKHEKYMEQAIALAKKGEGFTHPNPIVGCVIVKKDKVIGKGYHKRFGDFHAEINALLEAKENAKGATLYVTLEPCNYVGKTPACTEAIINAGIKNVVVGMKDPNPLNNGKGIKRLRRNGVKVETGICHKRCQQINLPFIKHIKQKLPYVSVKIAQSLDGKIAASSGDSKWITNEKSREYVQKLRAKADVVLTGVNTIITDDACLLPRIKVKKYPVRVILDTTLRIPINAKIIKTIKRSEIIVFASKNADAQKRIALEKKGIKVFAAKIKNDRVDIKDVLKTLDQLGLLNVMVEAGSQICGSFFDKGLVDKVLFFIAPKIIGGKKAFVSIGGKGVKSVSRALTITNVKQKTFGSDLFIEGKVL